MQKNINIIAQGQKTHWSRRGAGVGYRMSKDGKRLYYGWTESWQLHRVSKHEASRILDRRGYHGACAGAVGLMLTWLRRTRRANQ
jgi:hypothetical protein